MVSSFSIIEEKLQKFTKKYYFNKILRGLIIWFLLILLFLIIVLSIEFFLYLDIKQKILILLFLFVFFSSTFIYLIIKPLFKYLGFLKTISKKEINDIIVKHFPDLKDKLLNTIELNDSLESSFYSKELIISSIDQKIKEINKFSFVDSINLKDNLSLVYYFLGAVFISFLISIISPNFFSSSSYRLLNYETTFEKPSPYQIKILNEKLNVGKGEDYILKISISGNKPIDLPNIIIGNKNFLMKQDSLYYYSYKFNNINNDINFQFEINKFKSQFFELNILEKPILKNFSANLIKPLYTNSKNENFDNITEFSVPEGTNIQFSFNSVYTDSVILNDQENKNYIIDNSTKNIFSTKNVFKENVQLSLNLKNEFFTLNDYLKLNITTIKDEFPTISVQKLEDSIEYTKIYFRGVVGDDYGFSKLNFIIKNNDIIDTSIELNFLKNIQSQDFYYAFDFIQYKNIYKTVNFFFEVSDNDQVNGQKSAISEIFSFVFPDENEIFETQNNDFNTIQDIISNSMNLTDQLKKDLFDVEKKLISTELSEWERKEIQKNILNKKNSIDKEIEKLKQKSDEINSYLKSFSEQDQQILDKQKQIQDLLEDVFSDDLKKMLDEFNKMMQDYKKDQINDIKDKLDISLDDLSKQLDKNLEMLKKMQIEQQLDLLSQGINSIINEQDSIVKSVEKQFNQSSLKDKEEKLKERFSNFEKMYNEINELNEKLDQPLNLFEFKQEFDEIKEEFSNSIDNIGKSNKNKSKESMSKNLKNLKSLDFNMKQMLDSLFKEQNSENLEDLLQILDNLITYSFNQEEIINSTDRNNFNSINFSKQKKLFNDFEIIKDSLYTLAKREPSLDSKINKELVQIQFIFKDIEKNFSENVISTVVVNQQKVLTSVNDLSLFLSEIIKQLQKSMANSMPGNKNCNKPGNNPNPNSMSNSLKNMQKSLQQQLEKAMQMMKEGKSGKSVNNELGKAISQQEAMHDLLQKMMSQGQVGSSAYETLKQADQLLNRVKDDILRNNISSSTIERQKQILTRLLEADKAENEREIDEKRKSNTADKQFLSKTGITFENKQTIDNFEEKLLKNKLILNSYYQVKYQNYINVLDSINGEIYKGNFINK